jgi:hypothetical protein
MDAQTAVTTPETRVLAGIRLRERGLLLAWQQSDEAGLANELERAYFLLDRVYPEMPAPHRESTRAQLRARWEAGTWHGFRRPESLRPTDE